jgi:hypothetical protein
VRGRHAIAPNGSADFVMTFRNIQMGRPAPRASLRDYFIRLSNMAAFSAPTSTGELDQPQNPLTKSGYMRQEVAIGLSEKARFRLVSSSEHANDE